MLDPDSLLGVCHGVSRVLGCLHALPTRAVLDLLSAIAARPSHTGQNKSKYPAIQPEAD